MSAASLIGRDGKEGGRTNETDRKRRSERSKVHLEFDLAWHLPLINL